MIKYLLLMLTLFTGVALYSQEEITLKNASFEAIPMQGDLFNRPVKDWYDCGRRRDRGETAPDIHPANLWENTLLASEGNTYLGLVVRDNSTWESVAQVLSKPLSGGSCYELSVELARSPRYVSRSKVELETLTKTYGRRKAEQLIQNTNYYTPVVLRIWGGTSSCDVEELLAESIPVTNGEWKTYHFKLDPKSDYRYLVFEAFYKTPVLVPYNGHILLDNISVISSVNCEKNVQPISDFIRAEVEIEEELAVKTPRPRKKALPIHKKKRKIKKKDGGLTYGEPSVHKAPKHSNFSDINKKTIKKGQILNLEKVYFISDTSAIEKKSFKVLNELFIFLSENENLEVEIGGHTNSTPSNAYCDKLSTERAQIVANYLTRKGIDTSRISYKGYGKRNPIASNKTKSGRKKNQRVEVKVINVK